MRQRCPAEDDDGGPPKDGKKWSDSSGTALGPRKAPITNPEDTIKNLSLNCDVSNECVDPKTLKALAKLYKNQTGLFSCYKCGKKYSQSPTLWRHIKYECGKGPQFHCPFCMKGFTRKFTMLKHADKQHGLVQY
ncbi:hypothetical protein RUM43_014734 [Polyplax serrata]|uniref:C2H2-type domain-containing protein n=1 Tax=Polyplax serrata TaxID=468196 RepID=A0AAN8NIB8_POLSC